MSEPCIKLNLALGKLLFFLKKKGSISEMLGFNKDELEKKALVYGILKKVKIMQMQESDRIATLNDDDFKQCEDFLLKLLETVSQELELCELKLKSVDLDC